MPRVIRNLLAVLFLAATTLAAPPNTALQYQSSYMRVEMAPDQPAFAALSVDSLGKRKLGVNPLRLPERAEMVFPVRRVGTTFEYRPSGASSATPAVWTFQFSPRLIRLRSHFTPGNPPPPLVLNFNPHLNHATLLGLINDDSSVRLPALLHLPDLGTFRITSSSGQSMTLGYDARRFNRGAKNDRDYVRVTFPAATAAKPNIEYNLEVVAIYPDLPGIARDPRFDGFRRDWLNIFQLNPRERVLANHAASDPVAFTVFEYSSVAIHTPPLAPGLTALDIVRQTLDRYLGGMKGYGMAGYYDLYYDFSDTYPSLLMAASDYVNGSKDHAWLEKNYAGIKDWATKMLAMDMDGDGLIEYPMSGNYKSWPEKVSITSSELVGHHWLWPPGRLLECACLSRPAEHGGTCPPGEPSGRCATLYRTRGKTAVGLFSDFLRSPNRCAGRMEERGRRVARLLLYVCEQCRHNLWIDAARQSRPHNGPYARQNESSGLHKF